MEGAGAPMRADAPVSYRPPGQGLERVGPLATTRRAGPLRFAAPSACQEHCDRRRTECRFARLGALAIGTELSHAVVEMRDVYLAVVRCSRMLQRTTSGASGGSRCGMAISRLARTPRRLELNTRPVEVRRALTRPTRSISKGALASTR